jgi:hypothetical protein
MSINQRREVELEKIQRILHGTAYLPGSNLYKLAKAGLERMTQDERNALWQILILKGAAEKVVHEDAPVPQPNKAWSLHRNPTTGDRYVAEISELNAHPGQPIRGPWNEEIEPGGLHPEIKEGETILWEGYTQAPNGLQAKVVIFND